MAISLPIPLPQVDFKKSKALSGLWSPWESERILIFEISRDVSYKSLRKLADVATNPLSMILEKLWQSGGVPGNWKKGYRVPGL